MMRRVAAGLLAAVSFSAFAEEVVPTQADSTASALATLYGTSISMRLDEVENMGIEVNRNAFVKALGEILSGGSTGFDMQGADNYMREVSMRTPRIKPEYKAAQDAFLAAQEKREGVVKTPSGLLFEVISEGEGAMPQATDRVEVKYTGRLSDGKEFDSSRGNSVTFGVSQLIPGFTEGLKMMKPGGKYRLIIPSDLGYGDRGAGREIAPGAALDFEVELVSILK